MTETLGTYFTERKQRGRAGLPVYSVTLENGLVPRDTLDRRTESALDDEAHALVEPGDIAYNMMRMWQGALGVCERACLVSPAYVVMQPSNNVDVAFAAAWMKSERGLNRLWAYSHGITDDRLRLYPDDFLAIPVSFPPLAEQRRIAAVLTMWTDAVAIAQRLSSCKRQRFERIKASILSAVKGKVRLSETCLINRSSLSGKTPLDYRFQYFPIGEDEGAGGWMSFGEAPSRARRLASPGDIVYSTVRPMLRRSYRAPDDPLAVYSTGYAILNPNKGQSGSFIYHCLTSQPVERQIEERLAGSNYPAISSGDLGEILLPLVNESEQTRFADVMDEAATEVNVAEEVATLLKCQKRGLMQKLLTGEWRVPPTGDAFAPGGPSVERLEAAE